MSFFTSLWQYLLATGPYLILGLFISGIVHQFISIEKIQKSLGKSSMWNVIKAAIVGIPLPLCSCSVIPTSVTLRKSGASNGATSSFLIATPESGIDSISVTYALMDLPMTILRPVAAFFSAFVGGVLNNAFNDFQYIDEVEEKKHCCHSEETKRRNVFVEALRYGFVDLLKDIALWLTIGLILGALINFFVPEDMFFNLTQLQSRLLILAIGVPFYICASATTPIAAGLILKGLSPGAAILLLLVGPATNISNILVLQKYIGKKGVFINIFAIVVVGLGFSYLVDFFYVYFDWATEMKLMNTHHEHHSLFSIGLTIVFLILLGNALFLDILDRLKGGHH